MSDVLAKNVGWDAEDEFVCIVPSVGEPFLLASNAEASRLNDTAFTRVRSSYLVQGEQRVGTIYRARPMTPLLEAAIQALLIARFAPSPETPPGGGNGPEQ